MKLKSYGVGPRLPGLAAGAEGRFIYGGPANPRIGSALLPLPHLVDSARLPVTGRSLFYPDRLAL